MKIKHVFILFFLSLLLFSPYFLRQDLTGADPYHYLSFVCQENYSNLNQKTTPPLFNLILPLIGCSILGIKLMLFALLCASVYFIACLGELFNEKNGWMAAVFALGLSPVMLMEFVKFENDQFAFPLLFAAAYYFFKGILSEDSNKKFYNVLFSVFLILFAAGFWYGSVFFLIGLSLTTVCTAIISIPIVFLWWSKLLAALLEGKTIIENKMFTAIPDFALLNLGFFVFEKNKMLLPLLFFSVIGILARKFAILAVPFLAVACLNLLDLYFLKKVTKISPKLFWGGVCLIMIVNSGVSVFNMVPLQEDWEVIDKAIELSSDLNQPLINSWAYGYWLHWRNFDTNSFGGVNDLNLQEQQGIVLTWFDLNKPCELLFDNNRGKIYEC